MKRNLITLVFIIISFGIFAQTSIYPPTLNLPANAAVKQMPNVLFQWGPVPGAFKYKVQADTSSSFTDPQEISTIYSAANGANLLFGQKYYWRVKAIGASDSSAWSAANNFYVIDTVKLLKPTNGSKKQKVSCFVRWTAITGIISYDYEVDTNILFASPLYIADSFASNLTYGYSPQLGIGKTYFLRMRARHSKDVSEWCKPVQFTTMDTMILKRPSYDTIAKHPVTGLQWKQIGASNYNYSISTDTNFTTETIHFVDTASFYNSVSDSVVKINTDTLMFNTKYFWRVRAFNLIDTSGWTDTWKYTTIQYVNTLKPANDTIGVTTLTKFQWQKMNGVYHFNLEVDTSTAFANPRSYTFGGTLTQFTIPLTHPLKGMQSYYWRMKAINKLDTSDWSPVKHFTTGSPVGIEKFNSGSQVSIYPNPAKNYLNIEISNETNGIANVSIMNMVGQEVFMENINLNSGLTVKQLNTAGLSNGIYFIKVTNNGSIITRKLVIDK
jgi:hypothetical protein